MDFAKNGKPYLTCNDCGLQMFVRGKEGIRRFQGMLGQTEAPGRLQEISPLLEYTTSLRNRLRDIRNEMPILGEKQGLELEEKLVLSELARMEKVLEVELIEKRRQLREFRQEAKDNLEEAGSSGDV